MITLDRDFAHLRYSPQCARCAHLISGPDRRCHAFPNSIPYAIWDTKRDHRKPYDGDHGIQFEPVDAEARRIVAEMFEGDAT